MAFEQYNIFNQEFSRPFSRLLEAKRDSMAVFLLVMLLDIQPIIMDLESTVTHLMQN